MIWLQIIVVLSAIIIGTRLKGISLGIMGGLGLAILTFFFHLQPTEPPFCVLLIITSVVTAAGTLEAAGGLGYLSSLAEKAIK
ncbi:C4-dicarboxylate ABC transporter, partial [Rhizobium leguminosarum]|nr:C4-dicarboxylate ABC transporter [Rhizobium leguminosarum]